MKLNLTPNGVDLLLRSMSEDVSIVFEKIALGNGADASDNENNMATEMSNTVKELQITGIDRKDGEEFVTLIATLNNSDIEDRFSATETGIYVKDPADESKSILFAYAYAPEYEAPIIPAVTDYLFETIENIRVYVGTADNITAIIAGGVATASKEELQKHTTDTKNPHKVTASQVGLGNVPNVTTNNQKPTVSLLDGKYNGTYTDGFVVEDAKNGEGVNLVPKEGDTLQVIVKKLASLAKEMVTHLNNTSNPHNVSSAETGAPSTQHTHSATQITSGILSVARGGTGTDSLKLLAEALREFLPLPIFGTYVGDGTKNRLIKLPFAPKAVLVVDCAGRMGDISGGITITSGMIFGGLAFPGHDVHEISSAEGDVPTNYDDYDRLITVTDEGFVLMGEISTYEKDSRTNSKGLEYRYIAWP